ncbi:MAG TPA: tail fiber domain-containing protein, partial [Pyrinomonadaceae bacterium]
MKHMKRAFTLGVFAAALLACLQTPALGQTNDGNIANMSGGGSGVRWDILVSHAGGTLTITFPDGRAIRKSLRAGASPEINLSDRQLENLPDGVYSYELTLFPVLSAAQREAMAKARGNDDDSENERMLRKRPAVPTLNKSGSFTILNGLIVIPGAIEGQSTGKTRAVPQTPQPTPTRAAANTVTRLRNHRFSLGMPFDFVIADDTIIQGSACVGLDCVNGEVFGFDTIRLKENNTRIQFDDTSAAGFPTNNWQIRANSSAAGGASFLAFVDQGTSGNSETGTIVFEVDAGAPANSLKVSSSGKVGIRTATPVLDVHVNSSDSPAFRMEQNSSGGFTAQTWDIGANEANWFVRDVTGGSRLPLRIRPGAPTSSIDISASGNVGVGTASPTTKLELHDSGSSTPLALLSVSNTNGLQGSLGIANGGGLELLSGAAAPLIVRQSAAQPIAFYTSNAEKVRIDNSGNVGIGTAAPDQKLSVNGDADKTGGNTWLAFSDERLKNIKGNFNSGLKAVMQLQPIRYEYKQDNALGLKSNGEHIGFGAQSVQKIIPEAVTKNSAGYLMVNGDPIMWTMLNAIKEQQKEIEQLKG